MDSSDTQDIPRPRYLDMMAANLGTPVIQVLTGLRRSGKSTLLRQLHGRLIDQGVPEDQVVLINLESLEFDGIRDYRDLYAYIKARRPPFACIGIDEIQNVEGWEKAVASMLADGWGNLVITGSNAALLSSELATRLTGRYIELPVYPLGFAEFREFRRRSLEPEATVMDAAAEFQLYLRYGGLPGIHRFPLRDDRVGPYLAGILDSILLKDVVQRHRLRDVGLLERIAHYLMANCGNITSAKSIADYLKAQRLNRSVDSVLSYLTYLSEAFLFHRVRRYDIIGKRCLEINDKFYAGDFGLRQGIVGYRERDIAGLLENAVYLELRRRGWQVFIGVAAPWEVDFVAEKAGRRAYYQVALTLEGVGTAEREFGSLAKIPDNYPKYVLTMDEHQSAERDGIHWRNLRGWLLAEPSPSPDESE